ncbi:hypothetical protein [Actinomadura parmotrematis]|uniref:Uncharacterized protein n=1 Tax=Actinomadura parmotrematis TaxID=2864039 RepID=A0ABS7FXR9_9ACTN|nr:hypothetical protein [Actinomadura parmotrematis]MBW8484770.1 hypothetical protein [Actinomadura parmotrematis]
MSAILTITLTACSHEHPTARPQATPPPTAHLTGAPEPEPDLTTVLTDGPHNGNGYTAPFSARRGPLWLATSCQGTGTVKISLPPLAALDIPCSTERIDSTLNRIDLTGPHNLTLHVSAAPTTTWSLRIQR